MLSTEQQDKLITALLKKKQNTYCADCNSKSPCWASLDFGVFVCMNCSGAHRSLGPSITRIKSTKLDSWNKDWLDNMQIGNSIINQYWEHDLMSKNGINKPTVNSSLNDIIKYVQQKYIRKRYVDTKQSLDPLKRYKSNPSVFLNKQNQIQIPKQIPSKPKSQKNDLFSQFDKIGSNSIQNQKVKKPQSDLLSFQIKQNKKTQMSFITMQDKEQHKFNLSQFNTSPGILQTKKTQQISFENLLKQEINKQTVPPHQNYFLGQNHNHGAYHYSLQNNHINGHQMSVPQFDKAQYVTMNINMNMYPGVMNINMNQPPINYQSPQPSFLNQMNYMPAKQNPKISLQSNINFNNLNIDKKQTKNEQKSWVDQWK